METRGEIDQENRDQTKHILNGFVQKCVLMAKMMINHCILFKCVYIYIIMTYTHCFQSYLDALVDKASNPNVGHVFFSVQEHESTWMLFHTRNPCSASYPEHLPTRAENRAPELSKLANQTWVAGKSPQLKKQTIIQFDDSPLVR